jgi:hypothetical protein
MIDTEERMDKDLDRIYDIIGEERVPGENGNAMVTSETEGIITSYTNGALNKYNSFTNLETVMYDKEVADAVANFMVVAVERDMNKKFHKSLTVLEQNGLISMEKFEDHKASVTRAKQLTSMGVYATFSLAPIVCNCINNYLNKNEIVDFVIGAYSYINQDLNPLIIYDIKYLLSQMDIKVTDDKIKSVYSKYCNDGGMSYLPIFSKRNRNIFGDDGKETLAKEIVSRCDLHDENTSTRCMEFLEDFLRIDMISAEQLLKDSEYSQNFLSDITWYTAVNYRYVFLDFIKDIGNAQQFAFYDIANDPYCKIREERRHQMENIINDVSARKGLFLTMGKRKDIIDASAKMLQLSLNPSFDVTMDIKMIKREKKVLELYGL